ncbi:MAG: hypothetical protein QME90_13245, partial [Thermodesulfobacteriota bacterium]|nr:hypothetical protein [Thermodesulfobacteriota bacterium]
MLKTPFDRLRTGLSKHGKWLCSTGSYAKLNSEAPRPCLPQAGTGRGFPEMKYIIDIVPLDPAGINLKCNPAAAAGPEG